MTVPDFPWGTVVLAGCVFYGVLCLIIVGVLCQPLPRRKTFECRSGMDWHYRCINDDCECECHD